MNKLQETLVILNHFEGRIKGRINYCKRNIDFNPSDCIESKLTELYQKNLESSEKYKILNEGSIARECADKQIIIHSYLCLNIIDNFSFNDEYLKFFTEKVLDDEKIAKRVRKVRQKNKELRRKINWEDLNKYRNVGLAHNLRIKDENKNYRLSVKTLAKVNNFMSDLKKSIEYSEIIELIFDNIKKEFSNEFKEAYRLLKIEIIKEK